MAEGIQFGGKVFPVSHPDTRHPIPVFAWNDGPGTVRVPEFKAGDGYNKPRAKAIDLVVWHWTGGEAEPDRMAETLRKRKLGVEFAISRLGNVFQFCDPAEVDTADAGTVNSRSVGVEMVCYGFRRLKNALLIPKLGRDRVLYDAMTHGRKVPTAQFYKAQISSALALAGALSEAIDIPRQVPPLEVDGVHEPVLWKGPSRFKGHCGHFHVTKSKRDPGPMLIDALHDHFEGLA